MRCLKSACSSVLDTIFPSNCKVCRAPLKSEKVICSNCFSKITLVQAPYCRICGTPSPKSQSGLPDQLFTCSRCHDKAKSGKQPFTAARSTAVYNDAIRPLIHLFKYKKHISLANRFAKLMLETASTMPDFDIITYVPLHKHKLQEREYNQSLLLADSLAGLMHKKLAIQAIIRTKNGPPQVGLSRREREKNMKNIFHIPAAMQSFAGRSVLLIDDICTTGSTSSACAGVITTAGADNVYLLTLAMATP